MYSVCFVVLYLVSSISAVVEPLVDYHINYGIPNCKKIQDTEQEFFNSHQVSPSIVGGINASPFEDPYLGGLVITLANTPGSSVCGSSLISNRRLVTAAHCWRDESKQATQFEVVLGSKHLFQGGTRIKTSTVFTHPNWKPSTLTNDIAVIYLPRSVSFTGRIRPVTLPSEDQDDSFVGRWARAVGYGKTADEQDAVSTDTEVSHVTLRVIPNEECEEYFDDVTDNNICTSGSGHVGICFGDSGGPLVVKQRGRNMLIGISSFVATRGCELNMPSAFTRVTSFYDFIHHHM